MWPEDPTARPPLPPSVSWTEDASPSLGLEVGARARGQGRRGWAPRTWQSHFLNVFAVSQNIALEHVPRAGPLQCAWDTHQ